MVEFSTDTWQLTSRYRALPSTFYSSEMPTPVKMPQLLIFNHDLAAAMGLGALSEDAELCASWLSGNTLPPDAQPLAQAYAGHQFGHFTMLGDGRAILLGEQLTPHGQVLDVQLKGAGPTQYSRRGDGRATLRSMLREYLMSEAMHHLGISSSRSLAVVASGQPVYRETIQPGAVLTRVMRSHIRVGTLEYARHFCSQEDAQKLLDFIVEHYYPHLAHAEDKALALLETVMWKQMDLVIHWLRVGFIHGVMNTDNCSITAETFDYGPCAFMNAYHGATVFSSIDTTGRYAYNQQPGILQWNMAILASALLPQMKGEEEQAVAKVKSLLDEFVTRYHAGWNKMICAKIGLHEASEGNKALAIELLTWMQTEQQDYTNTFMALGQSLRKNDSIFINDGLQEWMVRWRQALQAQEGGEQAGMALMLQSNPAVIPRNHLLEAALDAAEQNNFQPFEELLHWVQQPYTLADIPVHFTQPPPDMDKGYKTFCGT